MAKLVGVLTRFYSAYLLIGGILWALDFFLQMGWSLTGPEWLGPYLGVGIALVMLEKPYRERPGLLEIVLGLMGIAAWLWMAVNYQFWQLDIAGYTPQKWVPGLVGLVLMQEGLRKSCGLSIALLVWAMIAYGLFGYLLPGALEADQVSPQTLVMYLYADTNGVPGFVLAIIASLVLAFIVFGKLMEVSGATQFFNDSAMAFMGHRRGGPAKVAVVASGLMGSISGSPVSNIMSTGVITIPLMKRLGFKPAYAGAIEAVASTGGQIAPPVMGAVAFLMAEFLQIPYMDVVIAAIVPAFFYYACLFMQIDAMAKREGLVGLPRSELPIFAQVLRDGWLFAVPLVVLVYLLFWGGTTASGAALGSSALLLVFALVKRKLNSRAAWAELIFGGGSDLVALIMIAGGAGAVVGLMSITGLGQSLTFLLVQAGTDWGLLWMLILTAMLSVVLGMGMPSSAIYVVLASVIAPALVEMGVSPMGAHMFLFYFGVMSFLTPPVAVSAYVAAGLAGANMWKTGWIGMRLSAVAFLVPFLWAYDPALLMDGSVLAIAVVVCTTMAAVLVIAKAIELVHLDTARGVALALVMTPLTVIIGSSPIWLGSESLLAFGLAAVGLLVYLFLPDSAGGAAKTVAPASPRG